ncbi:MAG: hypothetical protein HOY79_17935 [Streptomyces sp.]|nr:hypothetical protein [Streptomyces sp.]
MISYDTIEDAMAARYAARQARIAAAAVADHSPVPADENTARAMLAATGHTVGDITISASDALYGALIAIGHHAPEAFMAAAHAITDTNAAADPFGLFDTLYGEIYNGGIEFDEMTDWGTEDVWHTHVIVLAHGFHDGTPGTPTADECHCIDHTWAMREVDAGTDGAIEVTLWRDGVSDHADDRYADMFGPRREDGDAS